MGKQIREGRLKKLGEVAIQIAEKNDDFQPFIREIMKLVKQFDSEKIEILIEQYLNTDRK